FLMGQRTWDTLAPGDREIILQAAAESTSYQRMLIQKADSEAYNALVAQGVRIDKVDTKPFIAATSRIYDKWYASPIGDYVRAVVKAAREKP
ncbi:MAG: TRAP transporter substrate-binding protein, partial [Betaproteobacteria bacterium]